jgi:hypothetical protein
MSTDWLVQEPLSFLILAMLWRVWANANRIIAVQYAD